MTDLPPPAAPAPDRTGASDPGVAAALADLPPEERARIIAEVQGFASAAPAPPIMVTRPAPPAPTVEETAAAAGGQVGVVTGTHHRSFTTRPPEEFGTVSFDADGETYHCVGEAPVDAIEAMFAVYASGDRMRMCFAMKQFAQMIMHPESWERYRARCAGPVTVPYPEGGPEATRTVPAIHLTALALHGEWLLNVYLGRPTDTPPPSPGGGDSLAPTTPTASTGGPSPAL